MDALRGEPLGPAGQTLTSFREHRRSPGKDHEVPSHRPRLLLVSPWSLIPPIHGGAVRIGNLIRHLDAFFEIDLLVFLGGTDDPAHREALAPFCRRIFFQRLPELPGATKSLPPAAAAFSSPTVRERVQSLIEGHGIELVVLEYAELGHLADSVPSGIPVVLVEHDIHFRSLERRAALDFDRRFDGRGVSGDALRFREYELGACRRAAQVHVMSEADRSFLAEELENELGADASFLRVIPNGVDTERYRPAGDPSARRRDLLFVGSFPHLPNQDALEFFLAEAWPKIRRRRPETRLTVAGARPPAWVLGLDPADGIDVAGEVDDLLPLYQSHRVLVAPIRAGSGTRLKILEALACGLPVVSTPLGAEGLDLADGTHLALAPRPEDMVAATLRCLEDLPWAESMARRGRDRVRELYDWKVIAVGAARNLLELLDEKTEEPGVSPGGDVSEPFLDPGSDIQVSLIVAGDAASASNVYPEELVEGLEAQAESRPFEMLWLGEEEFSPPGNAVRTVHLGGGWNPEDPARSLNRAAAAARGEALVFLGPNLRPLGPHWLRDLTTPLFAPMAPAAVQGGINSGFGRGLPRCESRLSTRWAAEHGGVTFSWLNAALRREVWEAFPFASGGPHEDRRWQRRIAEAGQQILLCWAALAEEISARHPAAEWRSAWSRGRSWHLLGQEYGCWDCLGDLARPRAYGGQPASRLSLVGRYRLRGLASWGHPAVEWVGNRLAGKR